MNNPPFRSQLVWSFIKLFTIIFHIACKIFPVFLKKSIKKQTGWTVLADGTNDGAKTEGIIRDKRVERLEMIRVLRYQCKVTYFPRFVRPVGPVRKVCQSRETGDPAFSGISSSRA